MITWNEYNEARDREMEFIAKEGYRQSRRFTEDESRKRAEANQRVKECRRLHDLGRLFWAEPL